MDLSLSAGELEVGFLDWNDPFTVLVLFWLPGTVNCLKLSNVVLGVHDLVVDSEVWHWIVHGISLEDWVLVLSASGRGADWVILLMDISAHSKSRFLGWSDGLLGCGKSNVEDLSIVGWLIRLGCVPWWESPCSVSSLSILKVFERVNHIFIHSIIWDLVVNWVWKGWSRFIGFVVSLLFGSGESNVEDLSVVGW